MVSNEGLDAVCRDEAREEGERPREAAVMVEAGRFGGALSTCHGERVRRGRTGRRVRRGWGILVIFFFP